MKININQDNVRKFIASILTMSMTAYTGFTIKKTVDEKSTAKNNNVEYIAPIGYHIEKINDNAYAVLNTKRLEYGENSTEKIYIAPIGYHIEIIDGKVYAISNENEIVFENSKIKKLSK